MSCDNRIPYFVARGFGHKEVMVKCGTTDPYGDRAQCEQCEKSPSARAEHRRIMDNADADNAWLKSAGWGEI